MQYSWSSLFVGEGHNLLIQKTLLYPCSSENLESSYPILPGFSNTPRPPHGRDNCSFSSWWHAQIFFDSRAPVLNHQIPDVLLRNLPLWNIQLLVVPELFCMVGAQGIYSIKSIICHLKNLEIIRRFPVQSAFRDNIRHLTSLLVWQADSVPIPAPLNGQGDHL